MFPLLPGKPAPINLDLLRRMMNELEVSLKSANVLKDQFGTETVNHEYLVELAKCQGFISALTQELTLLAGDFKREHTYASSPHAPGSEKGIEQLEALLGGNSPPEDDFGLGGDLLPFPGRKKPQDPGRN